MDTQRAASQEATPRETTPQEPTPKTDSQLKRRGLIGAVAALVAGVLAKTTTETAQAQGTPLLMGVGNNSTASTGLTQTAGAGPALNVNAATFGIGVAGNSTTTSGVFGSSTNGFGVQGTSTNNSAISALSAGFHGIVGTTAGDGSKVGVLGTAQAGPGVNGASGASFGVLGISNSTVAGTAGTSGAGPGVQGTSNSNAGVSGSSVLSVGVFGQTSTASQFAGQFVNSTGATGNGVSVQGSLSVTGIKSAIVPAPDGGLQRMYCMESTEAWFEDFGEARLSGGAATVAIPRDFAGVVDTSRYQVYVQPHDAASSGLAVTARRPDHFEVTELQGGQSNSGFSFRIVAKRKDVASPRLQRVPQLTTPPPSLDPRTVRVSPVPDAPSR